MLSLTIFVLPFSPLRAGFPLVLDAPLLASLSRFPALLPPTARRRLCVFYPLTDGAYYLSGGAVGSCSRALDPAAAVYLRRGGVSSHENPPGLQETNGREPERSAGSDLARSLAHEVRNRGRAESRSVHRFERPRLRCTSGYLCTPKRAPNPHQQRLRCTRNGSSGDF